MPGKRGAIKEVIIKRHVAEAYEVNRNTVAQWLKSGKLKGLSLREILEFDRGRHAKLF
jgi:transposase